MVAWKKVTDRRISTAEAHDLIKQGAVNGNANLDKDEFVSVRTAPDEREKQVWQLPGPRMEAGNMRRRRHTFAPVAGAVCWRVTLAPGVGVSVCVNCTVRVARQAGDPGGSELSRRSCGLRRGKLFIL